MPSLKALVRLLPYYRPYRRNVAVGLGLVIVSSALASVVPLFLRRALDGIRAGVALRNIWLLALAMVGVSLVAGALRYWMRDLLNGVSRWIEYDLRNALYAALEALDPSYYARTRTGDLMARLTNDLSAVRMAVGPAIMYLMNTIAGGAFALYFMLRIDARLTAIAVLPMLLLPVIGLWMGKRIHERFEAVQEHFGELTTLAQENLAGVRIVRAYRQEAAEIRRDERRIPREEHAARPTVRRDAPRVRAARRDRHGRRAVDRGCTHDPGNDQRRFLRRLRALPRHVDVAAHRARLGHQSVPARRGVDGSAPRHPRRALGARRGGEPSYATAPEQEQRTHDRVPQRRLLLSGNRNE